MQTDLWVVVASACAVPSGGILLQSYQVLIASIDIWHSTALDTRYLDFSVQTVVNEFLSGLIYDWRSQSWFQAFQGLL